MYVLPPIERAGAKSLQTLEGSMPANSLFELALVGSQEGLWEWERATGDVCLSARLRQMIGGEACQATARTRYLTSLLHAEDRCKLKAAIRRHAVSQEPLMVDLRVRTKGDQYRWFCLRGQALFDSAGRMDRMGGTLRDITDRKEIEADLARRDEQLRQAHRLEAVGSLAGGIAHVFNNLLQVIQGYTQYAMDGLLPHEQRYQDLEQVLKASDRAAALTRQLQGFSPKQMLSRTDVAPEQLVHDVIDNVRPLLGDQIELEADLAPGVGAMLADYGMLHQMLLTLCLNARDAMPDGGSLMLRTEQVELNERFCELHGLRKAGSYLLISVADTGCGMSPEERGRVFDPFFTAKDVGVGTGLGLALVYGIVQQHDGLIQVYSESGVGTNFKIYLPIDAAAGPNRPLAPQTVASHGAETILLAEDEPMVREIASRLLKRAGYSLLVASDGEEAVNLFQANMNSISLVLLDAVMPKLNGRQVYERIRPMKPSMPIVFCSGYAPAFGDVDWLGETGVRLVEKPFRSESLLRTVRETLDSSR